MLKNFIKTAYHNLMKHKVFSTLNIVGLSIGMACCLLLFQYVAFEKSYDSFNKNAGRIFRIRLDKYRRTK